jgi:hypothetical protein
MGSVWKQRKTGKLSIPQVIEEPVSGGTDYLHPVLVNDSSELRYYFKSDGSDSIATATATIEGATHSFEEAFLLLPDFFKLVEYRIDEEGKVSITPPSDYAEPEGSEASFVFEKMLLNVERIIPDDTRKKLVPGAEHPCAAGEDGIAATTSENCMALVRTEDEKFVVMYARNTEKAYRTEAPGLQLYLNNYFIPLLSADMSIWWYKIPNYRVTKPTEDPVDQAKWESESHARENAEEVLSIWHRDQAAFKQALEEFPSLEGKFYVGIYQRSYFCDELQMRFTNVARIGNDRKLKVSSRIQDLNTVHYNELAPNFPEIMAGGNE